MASLINHQGIVSKVLEHKILVTLSVKDECLNCDAKSLCPLEKEDLKILEIPLLRNDKYTEGQEVTVSISLGSAFNTISLYYLIPFLIVIISFGSSIYFKLPPMLGGLISFFSLFPFFVMLYAYREKFKKHFNFKLDHQHGE